jgi:hypothetical protein
MSGHPSPTWRASSTLEAQAAELLEEAAELKKKEVARSPTAPRALGLAATQPTANPL